MGSKRRTTLVLAVTAGALLALAGPAWADLLTPESGGSANADDIDTLYKLVLVLAIIVFVGVEGVLLYSLVKFKAKRGMVAAQIRGNTRLEISWTVGAAAILVFLAVFTFVQLDDIRNPPNSDPAGFQGGRTLYAGVARPTPPNGRSLDVEVNGQQYVWRFTYPDGDGNVLNDVFTYEQMVVPKGTTVTLDIRAQDVAHSWWIPKLGGKFDAVPGHVNHTWFKVPLESGDATYRGQCAELCGRNHANMIASVKAIEPAAFEAWIARKKREIQGANQAVRAQRREVERDQERGAESP